MAETVPHLWSDEDETLAVAALDQLVLVPAPLVQAAPLQPVPLGVQGVAGPPGPPGPIGLGIEQPMPIATCTDAVAVLLPEWHNHTVQFSAPSPVAILPTAALSALPDGYTATLLYVGEDDGVLDVRSADPLGGPYGLPARRASHYSDSARATFAPAYMAITVLKLDDARWLITGHYVP